MILHTKYRILAAFTIVMFRSEVLSNDTDDESEGDKLKEALILVEILKKAYIKAMDDNTALRAVTQSPRSEDLETCPMRTGVADENLTTLPGPYSEYTDFRRATAFPIGFRRMDNGTKNFKQYKDNSFAETINNSRSSTTKDLTSSKSNISQSLATASSSVQSTTSKDATANYVTRTPVKNTILKLESKNKDQPINNAVPNHINKATKTIDAGQGTKETKITLNTILDHKTNKKASKDPLQDEVEQELKNELSNIKRDIAMNFSMHFLSKVKKKWPDSTCKGTTRIHLAGSSKGPIPLPENNAFCFFNPNNALCRTII